MNIAILDFGMSRTHRRLNIANFKVLSKFANLYIVNSGNYYDELEDNTNVCLYNTSIVEKKHSKNKFYARLQVLDNMRLNANLFKKYKKVKFDYILIMGYEIITFSLWKIFFPHNIPIYIFQHQQIDELSNFVKRLFFSAYKNEIGHIVLEEVFKDYLKNEIKVKNIVVVHIISYVNSERKSKIQNQPFILGISSNNDEGIIECIIQKEKDDKFLEKRKTKMYLRSKQHTYEDSYLTVNNKFLSDKEYDEYYDRATAILAATPKIFVNRLSGPVLDAISAGKIVIGTPVPIMKEYEKMAPTMFKIFKNTEELLHILDDEDWNINMEELEKMQNRYAADSIEKEYRTFFK